MLAAGPPAEFVDSFAFPLPGETIFRFIGFPESDDEMLIKSPAHFSRCFAEAYGTTPSDARRTAFSASP